MGFIFDGLEAEEYDRNYSDGELVRRIAGYFRPHLKTVFLVVAMVVLFSLAQTIVPIAVSRGIDLLDGNPTVQLVLALAGGIAVLGSLGWFFNYIRQLFSARAVGDVVLALRRDAFASVMQRDLSFYDQYASGKIVSRVTSDTQEFSNVVTLTINLMSQLLLVVVIIGVLFSINVTLALLTIATTPLIFVAALSFRWIARWTSRRAQRAIAKVNSTIQETVSGISVAKSFRQESAVYADFIETNKLAYQVRLRQGLTFNTIFPVLDILAGLGVAIVVYFGGVRALDGSISAGDWYLFIQSLNIFYFPLTSIASFWSQFQQGLAASERVFALIDAEPKVVQKAEEPVEQVHGHITFDRIDFSYRPEEPILNQFSLDIPAGQRLAIVGHTGAGKSSLIRLINRFYEFQGGQLCIDGCDIRTLDLSQYRRCLGLVPQVPFLFTGSVADNIRYGQPDAHDDTVMQAALRLGSEWVEDLPDGLQTEVGERGSRLSLGQRQLVALARVLLQNPAIFILDEATASVDPFTEAQIQEGLDVVMKGRTSISIAHRLSTVQEADRIIVMRAGTIIEEGTHDQLLAQNGHYAELYNTYFRHQSLEYIEQVGAFADA
ncbi:MAG: ABC transporter ATP-binding protein [Chloroflexota bacterium]